MTTHPPLCQCCNKPKEPDIGYTGKCPTCQEDLEYEVNIDGTQSRHLICTNIECAGATFGLMMNWVRTNEIRGLGQFVVRSLIENGISNPAKLYEATPDDFSKASGSDKLGVKLHNNVQATKKVKLAKFLTGLNIIGLGDTNGKRLAKEFSTLDKILSAPEQAIARIPGVKTTAKKIIKGLASSTKLIDKLRAVVDIDETVQTGLLVGKSFCMTGLRSHKDVDLSSAIEENGGEVKSSVGKDLTYLIILDPQSTSNKAEKAREYGVQLISPDDFLTMIGQ